MGIPEQNGKPSSDPIELSWAAGFFDGEGSTFVNRHHTKHYDRPGQPVHAITSPALSVSQVELEPLVRFSKAVGGRRPNGPFTPRTENSQPYYRWNTAGRPSVVRILRLLWPYMSGPKKAQARRVWEELRQSIKPKSPPLPPLPEN